MTSFSQRQKQALVRAALDLAHARGWPQVTMPQLAAKAKIPLEQMQKNLASVNAVLPMLVEDISRQVFNEAPRPDRDADLHDALFEILMARFDILQKNRRAVLSMTEAVRRDPGTLVILLKAEFQAMRDAFSFVRGKAKNTSDGMQSAGLLGVFLVGLNVWRRDETLDMSKTMAALDRGLRLAGRAATFLRK